jgi:hypothetical protein
MSQRDWRAEIDGIRAGQRAIYQALRHTAHDPSDSIEREIKAGSQARWLAFLGDSRDSSRTILTAENADLVVLQHSHGSGRAMDAWVTKPPVDGVLRLHLLISVTWPDRGRQGKAPVDLFRGWARTNTYVCLVTPPDEAKLEFRFDVMGNTDPPAGYAADRPRFATASPGFEIDIAKWSGESVRIEGWPEGSAGVGGYIERRQINLWL